MNASDPTSRARRSGAELFARYAYPPNELGYCGPGEPAALLEAAVEGGQESLLAHLARQFEGAWPYLELIAGCNAVADPLDARVVEAYWIGNDLTRRVPPAILAASLDERFARRAEIDFLHSSPRPGTAGWRSTIFTSSPSIPGSGYCAPDLRTSPSRSWINVEFVGVGCCRWAVTA